MGINNLKQNIKSGKEGRNIGISTGLPEIDKIIYGIQKKFLYTVVADTSGGKTSFALDVFIYNLFKNRGDKKINILYYSFEMSSDTLLAKLLSRYIYDEFNVIITYEEILSLTKPISDEHLEYIEKSYAFLEELYKYFTVYDKSLSPNGIYATYKEWLKRFGEFIEIGEHKEIYTEFDPNEYKIAIIDHVGLITGQGTKKERIDTTVEYFIYFKNKCNSSGLFIQQINRNSKSMDRKLNNYELIQLDDLKDTSGTAEASDVVLALFYPYREKVARCEGYPIQNVLKHRFRLLQVLKNRFGLVDVTKGLVFYGEIGMFRELPRPDEIGDYEPYIKLTFTKKTTIDNKELDDDTNTLFTF